MFDADAFVKDYLSSAGLNSEAADNEAPEEGTLSKVLSYMLRARYATAGAAQNLHSDPLGAAWEGLKGKPYSWGDVFGLEEGKPTDDWSTWLGKEVPRFTADAVLDPVNLLFAPAKGAGIIGQGIKALGVAEGKSIAGTAVSKLGGDALRDHVAGSQAGRMFMHRLPQIESHGTNYTAAEDTFNKVLRENSLVPLQEQAVKANQLVESILSQAGHTTPQALATAKQAVFDVLEHGPTAGTSAEIIQAANVVQPLQQTQSALFDQLGNILVSLGLNRPGKINEPFYTYMPHRLSPEGQAATRGSFQTYSSGTFGDTAMAANATHNPHRTIYKWVDGNGNTLAVGKASDTRTGLTQSGGDYFVNGVKVTPQQAGITEKITQAGLNPDHFQLDPVLALYGSSKSIQGKITLAQLIKDGEANGILHFIGDQAAPQGMRALEVPGLEKYVTTAAVANRIENLAAQVMPDAGIGGGAANLVHKALDTSPGRALGEFSSWWKRNMLALHPGWYAGNEVSNLFQSYLGGITPAMIPVRKVEAAMVQRGTGRDVIEGISNQALKDELKIRGVLDADITSAERYGYLSGIDRAPKTGERVGAVLGSRAGDVAQTIANKWGAANEAGLNVGRRIEGNSRVAVLVDWLKRNAPDFASKTRDEQGAILDRAAQHAKTAMVDYGAATPFEKDAAKIIPFLQWQRGIAGRTAEVMANHPQRLNRMSEFLNRATVPMDAEDKRNADPYIREGMPIMGLFGKTFDSMANDLRMDPINGDRMFLASRMIPQGTVEALVRRPGDTVMAGINPVLKGIYELLANKSTFKDRPIDQFAGGALQGAIKPLVGGDYQLGSAQMFGHDVPASWEYLFGLTPAKRYNDTLQTLGRGTLWADDPSREPAGAGEKAAWWATGGKVQAFDPMRGPTRQQQEFKKRNIDIKSSLNYAAKRGNDTAIDHYIELLIRNATRGPQPQ